VAGASQPHKHLQLVPLPLGRTGPPLPVETLFASVKARAGIVQVAGLPFDHAFLWLDRPAFDDAGAAARQMHACYLELLAAVGLKAVETGGEARQSGPYNLLATRRWMLLVPRSRELFDSVQVNSLGFAGSMFVRDEAQMQVLKRAGPMAVLRETAIALA
jgi:ATP adenylyltransferase